MRNDYTPDELADVLRRNGFVECDIAACNCGSWHARYGWPERFHEIDDATSDEARNGETLLARVQRIAAENAALKAREEHLERLADEGNATFTTWKANYDDLRARLAEAERENERLRKELRHPKGCTYDSEGKPLTICHELATLRSEADRVHKEHAEMIDSYEAKLEEYERRIDELQDEVDSSNQLIDKSARLGTDVCDYDYPPGTAPCMCQFRLVDSSGEPVAECDYHSKIRARLAEAEGKAAAYPHLMDVYNALGVRWGDNPFPIIDRLMWRATDSADIVTVRTSWKEREVARLIRDHQKIIDTKRKSCPRCYGTGAIDAPTSADDPSCPACDGEGHE